MRILLVLLAAAVLVACGGDPCADGTCGACAPSFEVRVTLGGGGDGPVTTTGVDGVTCTESAGAFACTLPAPLEPGHYTITFMAPGHVAFTSIFEITAPGSGCCACPGSFTDSIVLEVDPGAADAGPDAAS